MGKNSNEINDEFYTQYEDIEKEINSYLDYNIDVFRNKIILCPCDDPEWSNFTKYNILGAIVWVGLFLNLGYFFENISYVKDHFSLILLTIIFISLVPIISAFIQSKMKVRVGKKGLVHEENQRNSEA